MATLLETITSAIQESLGGDPPPPEILTGLEDRLAQLSQVSLGWGENGIETWLQHFRALFNDQLLRDTLLSRTLQRRLPRLAAALTFLGVITYKFNGDRVQSLPIDWQRLDDLINRPGPTASNLNWWFSHLQKLTDIKLLQAYVMLAIFAPADLLRREYTHTGFTSLPSPGAPGISLQELLDLINSPLKLPLPLQPPLDFDTFQDKVDNALLTNYLALVGPDGLNEVLLNPAQPLDQLGIELLLDKPQETLSQRLDLGDGWQVAFSSTTTANGRFRVALKGNQIDTDAAAASSGTAEILLTKAAQGPALLVGPADGTRLEIGRGSAGLRFLAPPDSARFALLVKLEGVALVLSIEALRVLGSALSLPPEIRFRSDIALSYRQGVGLQAQGAAAGLPPLGAQFVVPLNLALGTSAAGLRIDTLNVRAELQLGQGFQGQVTLRFSAQGTLGPLQLTITDVGGWIGTNGVGVLPPNGIGLALDAGPVGGGGFLQSLGSDHYAGALQLKILGIGAFAYGIYERLPSGAVSFVALIGIRFLFPGIQIGFGFAISGFGGLVGLNRRADTDLLRERLASGAAANVLFNDNPMQNAPTLLHDLGQFFPAEQGVFIIGPTLQINWLSLLQLDVGVFIELPGPRKIFIVGSARLVIGGSEAFALVYLRLDFIGGIDFTKQLIFFDAALVNSHIIHILRLTGGVALRIAYGSNGYFLFSVGGFHPSFNPGALELPRIARAGAILALDVAIAKAWLKQVFYLALTSNTFQLGAITEAGIEIGPISAHGWFGFDALIQFKPFYFVARISAGFDVEVFGISLCSVEIEGQLSGPAPLVIQAKATVRILFVKVSASVTLQLGDGQPDAVAPISDLVTLLRGELTKPENLRATGDDRSVVFKEQAATPMPLVTPVGELIWEQRRAPLGLDLERLEGVPLAGVHRLTVTTAPPVSSSERDWFGVGTYRKLSDSEALNNARFSEEVSGLRVGGGEARSSTSVPCPIEINLVKLPKRVRFATRFGAKSYLFAAHATMQAEKDRVAAVPPTTPLVSIRPETWQVHNRQGGVMTTEQSTVQAFASAKQLGGVALAATEERVTLAGVL